MRCALTLYVALAGLTACAPVYVRSSSAVPTARSETRRSAPPRLDPAQGGPASGVTAPGSSALTRVLETMVWPLAVDRTSVLSSFYGMRPHPADGVNRFHAGLDLRAPEGTPVYAAADGIVVESGPDGAYGNRVVINHGAGLESLYGHHRENLVQVGDAVRRGQVIALVGHTGNATGDHVHFELRWRGGTVDPLVVLPGLRAPAVAR